MPCCSQLSCIVFRRQPKQPVQQTKLSWLFLLSCFYLGRQQEQPVKQVKLSWLLLLSWFYLGRQQGQPVQQTKLSWLFLLSCFYLGRQQVQPVQQVKLSSKIIAHMCENVSFSPNNVNGRGGTNRRAKARRRAKNAFGRHRLGDRKSCLGDRKSCNA